MNRAFVATLLAALCVRAARAEEPTLEERVRRLEERQTASPAPPGPAVQSEIRNPQSPIPSNVRAPLVERIDLGGQLRLRAEVRDPADYRLPGTFGRPAAQSLKDNNDLLLERIRLNVDVHVDPTVRVFVQIQDSRTFGQEASVTANDANLGLHQGWMEVAELGVKPLSIRAGRQELSYGDQRLVSPLDWSNTGRAFDAVLLRWKEKDWSVDLFSAVLVEGDTVQDDRTFDGLYASCTAVENHTFDLYAFHRRFQDGTTASESGKLGDVIDTTFGGRMAGKSAPWDYGLEVALQKGAVVHDRVDAWAAAATAGYTLEGDWKPRLGLELDTATGDRNPTDGKRESFDPLFPFGHKYQGYADVFSWRNGTDLALRLSATPSDRVQLGLDLHDFRLAEAKDAWYGSTATAIRRDPTGAAGKSVGDEADLTLRWKAHDRISIWTGYSRFHAGSYVRKTGGGGPQDWFFLQATLDF